MTRIITGGTVSIEDCRKHDGYPDPQFAPTRKIRVELTFAVPEEGDDANGFAEAAADIADNLVAKKLGVKYEFAAEAPASAAPKPAGRPKKPPSQPATAPTAGPTKAELEAQHLAALGATKSDAAAILGEHKKPAEENIDDLVSDPKPAAKEITDKDLVSATTKKNEVLKSAVKIRELVAQFFPEGKKGAVREILQARRQEYLDKLEALS